MARSRLGSSPAFNFALTMGVVNLFGDMTYEGGGAINGQFMATLGASAAVVSITAGEFLSYSLRSVSGYSCLVGVGATLIGSCSDTRIGEMHGIFSKANCSRRKKRITVQALPGESHRQSATYQDLGPICVDAPDTRGYKTFGPW